MTELNVIGAGFAGLVASIAGAEAGMRVHLFEAHSSLGGRARATPPPYIAQQGPHVLYSDGPWWAWLAERDLLGRTAGIPLRGLSGFRFRHRGGLRATPPRALIRMLTDRTREAPADVDFRTWASGRYGEQAARLASGLMGVATFDADPGRLAAAFVWERMRRVFGFPPPAKYVIGGWGVLIDRLAQRARDLGVVIETEARVSRLPDPPVIVATSLDAARLLLGDPTLDGVESGNAMLVDLAVRSRRGDAFVVSDLDEAGWLERYSLPDPSLAPRGESLVQVQIPVRDGEGRAEATRRLEAVIDLGLPGWRDRVTWRRDSTAYRRSGALDLPGTSWRDRPAVDRGDGVFLAGDQVAAPGLLSEVSFHSAIAAVAGADRSRGATHGYSGRRTADNVAESIE